MDKIKELHRASFLYQIDLFSIAPSQCFYLSISDFVDKFFGLNAIAGRIELGTSSKSKPEFYNGKKVIVNDKGVFYK